MAMVADLTPTTLAYENTASWRGQHTQKLMSSCKSTDSLLKCIRVRCMRLFRVTLSAEKASAE
jgi:hypothetical protein